MSGKGKMTREQIRNARKHVRTTASKARLSLRNGDSDAAKHAVEGLQSTCKKYGWVVRISESGRQIIRSGV